MVCCAPSGLACVVLFTQGGVLRLRRIACPGLVCGCPYRGEDNRSPSLSRRRHRPWVCHIQCRPTSVRTTAQRASNIPAQGKRSAALGNESQDMQALKGRHNDQLHTYRSSNSIPCRWNNSRSSSWNVILRWCSGWFSMYLRTPSTLDWLTEKAA
jgi:hypothetical protein